MSFNFANFWLAFIPIFVAVDALGVLPVFIAMVEGMNKKAKDYVIRSSLITALVVGMFFLGLGKVILDFLGIKSFDFQVAGGIVLFIMAISNLLSMEPKGHYPSAKTLGAVPLGVPLIVGPAVLTTALILADRYGFFMVTLSLVINILLAGIAFVFSDRLLKVLGSTGSRVISKLTSLLLAAIGVRLMRTGLGEILRYYVKGL